MTTIAALTEQVRILERTGTINPDTGGTVEGPPTVVAGNVRAAIVPRSGAEALGVTPAGDVGLSLGIVNTATHVVTLWFRPDVLVGHFVEYADPKRPTAPPRIFEITQALTPDERAQWLVLAVVERVA